MRSHAATCSQLPLLHLTHRHYSHTTYTIYSDGQSWAGLWAVTCYHLLCDQSTAIINTSRGGESCCCFPCLLLWLLNEWRLQDGCHHGGVVSWSAGYCGVLANPQWHSILYSCHYLCSFCGHGWIQTHTNTSQNSS